MSLVNEMLQDLQAREASDARPLAGLRAVPDSEIHEPGRNRPDGLWLLAGALVVTGVVAAAWLRTSQPDTPAVAALPVDYSAAAETPGESPEPSTENTEPVAVIAEPAAPQIEALDTPSPTGTAMEVKSRPAAVDAPDGVEPVAVVASVAPVVSAKSRDPIAAARPKSTVTVHAVTATDDTGEAVLTRTAVDPVTQLRTTGLAALRGGRRAEAEENFRQLVALEPADTKAHLLLHAALKVQSRTQAGQAVLRNALGTVSQPSVVAQVLARELLAQRNTAQAIVVLEQHRPAAFADLEYEATLAAAYQRAGRHSDSVQLYGRLLERSPGQPAWLVGLAISQEAGGDKAGARSSYSAAVRAGRLDPALARYARQRLALLEKDS